MTHRTVEAHDVYIDKLVEAEQDRAAEAGRLLAVWNLTPSEDAWDEYNRALLVWAAAKDLLAAECEEKVGLSTAAQHQANHKRFVREHKELT